MNKPVLFSFFSGSGFLDLGFENSGFDVAFVNEYHLPFLKAYQFSRKQMGIAPPRYGYNADSIESLLENETGKNFSELVVKAKSSGQLVGFIGGPPCPDFSVGGKNRGSTGTNGKLTRTYFELIFKDRPDFFVFENVKGLWRTKLHRKFYEEMKLMSKSAGYVLVDRLTNAIEYGAPQDRDRIFLFAIKKELVNKGLSDLDITDQFNWKKFLCADRDEVLSNTAWPSEEKFEADSCTLSEDYIPDNLKRLTVQFWFDKNNVISHPNASHCFKPKSDKFSIIKEGDDSKKSFKRLHRWRYSPTAAYGNNEVHLHPYKARRLSAAEALAIQSLPANFFLPPDMTLSDMFKTIGNGVPYLAAKGLAMTVADFFENHVY